MEIYDYRHKHNYMCTIPTHYHLLHPPDSISQAHTHAEPYADYQRETRVEIGRDTGRFFCPLLVAVGTVSYMWRGQLQECSSKQLLLVKATYELSELKLKLKLKLTLSVRQPAKLLITLIAECSVGYLFYALET